MARKAYTSRLYKCNDFNKNGFFDRDNWVLSGQSPSFSV